MKNKSIGQNMIKPKAISLASSISYTLHTNILIYNFK